MVDLVMVLFKRMIATAWKASTAPDIKCWLRVVLKWANAETDTILRAQRAGEGRGTITIWDKYILKLNDLIDENTG